MDFLVQFLGVGDESLEVSIGCMHFFQLLAFVRFLLLEGLNLNCWSWFWQKSGPNFFCEHLISQSRMSLRCTIKIQDRSIPRGVLHQGPPFWPASATWQARQISPIWMYPPETGTTAHTNRDAIFTETSHSQCLLDSGCRSKKSDYRDWWNNIW